VKKLRAMLIGVVIVAALAILVVPPLWAEAQWLWTTRQDSVESYGDYWRARPDGRHGAEARAQYDERGWQRASATDTVEGFDRYLQDHPDGQYVDRARGRVDDLAWDSAATTNTVEGFERYLRDHQDGKYTSQARAGVEDLRWRAALATNTAEAFVGYLQAFPQGRYETEARERIIPAGIEQLASKDAHERGKALEALNRVGEPAIRALLKEAENKDGKNRIPALWALAKMDNSVGIKGLIDGMENPEMRQALINLGHPAAKPLVELLKEEKNPSKLKTVIEILGELRDPEAVPTIVEFMKNEEMYVVSSEALGKIGGERAIDELINALGYSKETQISEAALVKIG
jgi:hypothetical protein